MDVAREHLWGQLLLERNLLGREDLTRLASERDALAKQGQDCSIGQMLVQQRRLDVGVFAALTREVEGRGRICYTCRRVFLAVRPEDPSCPQCGGNASLRPAGAPGMSGRFTAPPSLSGRFSAQAFGASVRMPAPGGTGVFHAATAPPATGSYPAAQQPQQSGYFPQPGASGRFAAPIGWGGPPASSAVGLPAVTSQFVTPPPSGGFRAAANPPGTGGFSAVDPYDPVGGPGSPPSTAAEAGEISSGELGVGKRFGKYEIIQELGRGGMGVVYKVRAPGQPGCLAVKVLLAGEFASPKLMERFREEARLAGRLRHPNIVAVHDVGEVDGIPYYAMDYIEGSELQDLIRQKNLPVRRGVEILVEVARAAHHAHEHGVVHRDLKPSNILIAAAGTSFIMDFGLAKNLDDDKRLTRSGVAIGTPYYMPPEQARGSHREMDARSDVYALGAILYEILTRRVPFTAKTQNELLRKIVEEEPQAPRLVKPGIPSELDTICLKALRKVKDDRYASALAMAEDLERWLAGRPILARPEPLWSVLLRKAQKNRTVTMAIAGVALLTLLSGAAIWQVKRSHDEERRLAALQRLEDEQRREKEEAERAARQAAGREREAALSSKQREASEAVRRGLAKALMARQVTTVADALRSLDEAERLLSDAIGLERELSPQQRERPATAYQRALVRRALCRWEDAHEDFTFAAKDAAHQARAHLARALIKLRWEADRDGARGALGDAIVASGLGAEVEGRDEETTAEGVAAGYLAYLQGNQEEARRRLLLLGSARNVMAAEANAALAYIARCDGAPLGGDAHVEQGLRPADQALLADAWRYDFLVDRAILRGRAGQVKEALRDLRAARALFPEGEVPDLAEAVVAAREGDLTRMNQALRSAERKAQRSQRVGEEVAAFARRLTGAPRPATPSQGGGAITTPPPPEEGRSVITQSSEGRVNFPPGADGQVVQAEVVITDDVAAVRLTLRGSPVDLDLFVHPDEAPKQLAQAQHKAESEAADETLVITRTGQPALQTGKYHVLIRAPKAPPRQITCQFAVRLFKRGEPLPYAWRPTRELTNVDYDRRFEPELTRAVQLRRNGDHLAACRILEEVEGQGQPDLIIIRISWLADAGRMREALAALDGMPADKKEGLPALFIRANLALGADDLVASRRHLERFVARAPEYLDPQFALGDLLLKLGDHDAAQVVGERIQQKDPVSYLGVLLVGAAETGRGEASGVEKLRGVALDAGAEMSDRLRAAEWLLRGGQAQKTLELIDEMAAKLGERPFTLELLRAEALHEVGRTQDGLDLLRTLRARVQQVAPQLLDIVDKRIKKIEDSKRP